MSMLDLEESICERVGNGLGGTKSDGQMELG